MKTIQQLLELSKNPYYQFPDDERAVLDDFLEKKRASESKKSRKKSSRRSSKKTPVTVRNIVKKAETHPPEAPEGV